MYGNVLILSHHKNNLKWAIFATQFSSMNHMDWGLHQTNVFDLKKKKKKKIKK